MSNEEQIQLFYNFLENNYTQLQKKYKQMCFLNHMTYDEDTLQETVLKVVDIIKRKGLKDESEKGIENYFFQSFKFNTYQTHLQQSKQLKDDNIDPFELNIIDEPYDEAPAQYADMASKYILDRIKEEFDPISVGIWRLRYIVSINGEQLNYKKIKEMTKIEDTRRRIVMINKWIRENITESDIKLAIKENRIFN